MLVPRGGFCCNKYPKIWKQLQNWGRDWKNPKVCDRKCLDRLGEIFSESTDIKGALSKRNEGDIIGHCRKQDTFHNMVENLTELYSTIMLKIEFISNTFGYLAKDISKYSMEDMALLFC